MSANALSILPIQMRCLPSAKLPARCQHSGSLPFGTEKRRPIGRVEMPNVITGLRRPKGSSGFGRRGALCHAGHGDSMLKITVVKNGAGRRLMIEGKLAEPCVSELERTWKQVRQEGVSRPILVDLSEVTSIDPRGEAALAAMVTEGARLTARGLYCGYIVRRLMKRAPKERVRGCEHKGTSDWNSTEESSSVSQCSANKETK